MSFDKPVDITLKITTANDRKGADYTFLQDWFGDNFRVATDKKDIVSEENENLGNTDEIKQVEEIQPSDLVIIYESKEV